MRLVIVEDHQLFRDTIRYFCAREWGLEVIGETASGKEAIDLVLNLRPDAVILDLFLPDLDGIEVARTIRRVEPNICVLVLSMRCDEYTVYQTEKLGLSAFVDKTGDTIGSLQLALQIVKSGEHYYSPRYLAMRLAWSSQTTSATRLLTGRQLAILALIAQGLTNKEIGRRMRITRLTAECHRRNIMRKLNVHGTPALIAFAVAHGIGQNLV